MQSDEQFYELAASELVNSPRKGLLIKCMTQVDGDENRAKSIYIKIRVKEMKNEIHENLKKVKQAKVAEEKAKKAEEKAANDPLNDRVGGCFVLILIMLVIIWVLYQIYKEATY